VSEGARTPQSYERVVVIGGGCYGSYYVRQLERALAAHAVSIGEIVVVDRDPGCAVAGRSPAANANTRISVVVAPWEAFLPAFLAAAAADPGSVERDAIVPSPLMPHLLRDWLQGRLSMHASGRVVRPAPLVADLDVPWQRSGEDGTHYVSYATWMCPINCIEPVRCPHTRAARHWTIPVTIQRAASAASDREGAMTPVETHVFHCTHRVYGVGMIDVRDVVAADRRLAARVRQGGAFEALIGTASHCHGAVGRVVVEPRGQVGT